MNGDPSCPLCSDAATRRHILSGCKVSLSQGRYTCRHNRVFKSLAAGIRDTQRKTNVGGLKTKRVTVKFVQEGEKINKTAKKRGSLDDTCDWEMRVDKGGKLITPQEIASTKLRPDTVLWFRRRRKIYFIELTGPWEASVVEAYERKKLRYVELGGETGQRGWKGRICPLEVGCRGLVARSAVSSLSVGVDRR